MLLLDTCTLLWLVGDRDKLSKPALQAIHGVRTSLHVSSISAFEIGIEVRKGRVSFSDPPEVWFADVVRTYRLNEVPISWQIALASTQLPPLHSDPADRIIVATAHHRGLRIATPDSKIAAYPNVSVVW